MQADKERGVPRREGDGRSQDLIAAYDGALSDRNTLASLVLTPGSLGLGAFGGGGLGSQFGSGRPGPGAKGTLKVGHAQT
jgi:hypothetical protein